jgi:hypothetical protein
MSELLYILYSSKNPKYLLLLPLGYRNGKLCALKTANVPKGEINKLRSSVKVLANLSLDQKLSWIKGHCPVAYKKAYRELDQSLFSIISKHPMD